MRLVGVNDSAWLSPAITLSRNVQLLAKQADHNLQAANCGITSDQLRRYNQEVRNLPPRLQLVDKVRDQIKRGVYETPDKIEAAVASFLNDLKG